MYHMLSQYHLRIMSWVEDLIIHANSLLSSHSIISALVKQRGGRRREGVAGTGSRGGAGPVLVADGTASQRGGRGGETPGHAGGGSVVAGSVGNARRGGRPLASNEGSSGDRHARDGGSSGGERRSAGVPAAEMAGSQRSGNAHTRGRGSSGGGPASVAAGSKRSSRNRAGSAGSRRAVAAGEVVRVTSGVEATAKEARAGREEGRASGSESVRWSRAGSCGRVGSAGRSGSHGDGHGSRRSAGSSHNGLDGLSHSVDFRSGRAGLAADVDNLVVHLAPIQVLLGTREGCSRSQAQGGEGKECGRGEMHDGRL